MSLLKLNLLARKPIIAVPIQSSVELARHYTTEHHDEHNIIHRKPNWVPFGKARYGNFIQEAPVLENQYLGNAFLRNYMENQLPVELFPKIDEDLKRFGNRVANDINKLAIECERNKPILLHNSAWGGDTSELIVCDAWNKQKDISAEEGLIAHGYNRNKYSQWARLYQFAKLYLYAPSSGLYSCPLAMTDGAAKTLEQLNLLDNPVFKNVYNRLTTTDPVEFWTSGQWMTEKEGGSDVASSTETVALPMDSAIHKLYGYKWFSSASDANIALTLARVSDDEGNCVGGTTGLTLFYVPVKENGGQTQKNIHMIRLKDKLGTRQLPTAELLLDGVLGTKISEEGRGIGSISHMLQITRIHNAVSCSSYVQRVYSLARDYAHRRKAFGKKIIELPLHAQTLARIDMVSKATFIFSFEIVRILGLIENNFATDEEKLLFRILNPLAKLYNAKAAIPAISEGIECFGGQGAMEDTGIPYLYRDVQIFSIWEGTSSVLAMDVIRSIIKTNGESINAFRSNVKSRLKPVLEHDKLKDSASKVISSLDEIIKIGTNQPTLIELGARDFSFSLSNLFIASLFLANATSPNANAKLLALRFCETQNLAPFLTNHKLGEYSNQSIQANYNIVTENYRK